MAVNIEKNVKLDKFKFKTTGKVRFHEVDAFKVVHNLQYFYWTEVSRVDYCNFLNIGVVPVSKESPDFSVFLVHSEIDYYKPATFLDDYFVHTRVKRIGNSSIEFEHVITNTKDEILAIHRAIEVYVDRHKVATIVPDDIRRKIIEFENNNIEL